uniref:Uncharacterized protein n=1 Tax=Arundo donax TaxID=35708 RepID=A0A0A9BZM5_ARUDO
MAHGWTWNLPLQLQRDETKLQVYFSAPIDPRTGLEVRLCGGGQQRYGGVLPSGLLGPKRRAHHN